MFSRMGSVAFRKDLDNILVLCDELGNPQNQFKSIHVGGTNGKGSVSHMLASIMQTSGMKTGLYTSPHLYDFRERIKVDGSMADQDFVVQFVQKTRPLIEKIHPSFFEITVAMAFEYFAMKQVDIAIVEVGLGGRLDSTNIIRPLLSIITNIGWDHMNMLGNSLQAIATEKAGIIKESTPVVIGEKQAETFLVFEEQAKAKQAALFFASDEMEAKDFNWKNGLVEIEVLSKKTGTSKVWETDLQGIYQGKNISTVLKACSIINQVSLLDRKLENDSIAKALKNVRSTTGLHGRWEVIHQNPKVVLEVAHNPDGISQMLLHLKQISFDQLHIIIGMVKDKDINKVLELLPREAQYYFTQAAIPRALDADDLKKQAAGYGLKGVSYKEVNMALENAIEKAGKNDLVLVCGSIFLVAEVKRES